MAVMRDAVDVLRALGIWPGQSQGNSTEALKKEPTAWAETLAGRFEMDADQSQFFRAMSAEDAGRLTKIRDDLLSEQPSLRVVVVIVPDSTQRQGFRHEIRTESLSDASIVKPQVGIVIAHCDAHCQNWGWGPG